MDESPQRPRRAASPPHDLPSVDLLRRAQDGDAAALDDLCTRYLSPLQRWASGRLPARARDYVDTDDLVQETMMRALTHVEGFEPRHPGAMQAYLRRAVMNRLRDEIRRVDRRPQAVDLDSGLTAAGPSPLENAIGSQALARYEAALSRLGEEERAAVVARVEMRSSYQQIAAELGKPSPDAARMMVTRALLRLAEEMADGE